MKRGEKAREREEKNGMKKIEKQPQTNRHKQNGTGLRRKEEIMEFIQKNNKSVKRVLLACTPYSLSLYPSLALSFFGSVLFLHVSA